ncbi:MAG TPA: carboxypeptidase regulatory-like domain-containing protein [Planctomycetes bacterium]|nr:carboxypeptidase regulatory-like domain-containing protein [Planctomycetota bacterium]
MRRTGKTDEEGVWVSPWPSGIPFVVAAWGFEEGMGDVRSSQPALDVGEERTVVLEVPVGSDFSFHGVVVRAEDGSPVSTAEVFVLSDEPRADATVPVVPRSALADSPHAEFLTGVDEGGLFEVDARPWERRGILEDERLLVYAEGFAPVVVGMTPDHLTVESARRIPLVPGSEVLGHVIGAGSAGFVELSCESTTLSLTEQLVLRERLVWSDAWGDEGGFSIGNLPAEVRLRVRVLFRDERGARPLPSITLEPGETRIVEWNVGSDTLIHGVVLDEHGEAVPSVAVIAIPVAAGFPEPASGFLRMGQFSTEGALGTRADVQGRFELSGVAPGSWVVGVSDAPSEAQVSETGTVLEVPEGVSELEVRVPVFRDLGISGVVRSEDEAVLGEVRVSAIPIEGEGFVESLMGDDGRFDLRPLAPGHYRVSAWAPGALVHFASTEVEAGERDITLWAQTAGGLRGRVLLPSGEPASMVSVRLTLEGSLDSLRLPALDGQFTLLPVPPGTYDLIVSSQGLGALAIQAQVDAGRVNQVPDLRLEPAGRVSLPVGETWPATRAELRGPLASYPVDLWPGTTAVLTLPPGSYELTIPSSSRESPGKTFTFVVHAGEEDQLTPIR